MNDTAKLERERDETEAIARKWQNRELVTLHFGLIGAMLTTLHSAIAHVVAIVLSVTWVVAAVRSHLAARAAQLAWNRWLRAFYFGWKP